MVEFATLTDLFRQVVESYADPRAFNARNGEGWKALSTQQFKEAVVATASILKKRGVTRGEAVGLMAPSSPQWIVADFAILLAGGVTVPIFPDIAPENLAFELADSGMRTLFVGSGQAIEALKPNRGRIKSLLDFRPGEWEKAIRRESEGCPSEVDVGGLVAACKESDLATIIYTSGSTGVPKGVELTHKAIVSQLHGSHLRFGMARTPNDAVLSVLPLAHIFERMVMYYHIGRGIPVYFADDPKRFGEYLRELHPTYMEVVPRLLERVLAAMRSQIEAKHGAERAIALAALRRAERAPAGSARKGPAGLLADLLVYRRLRAEMGGRLLNVICGGAPLPKDVATFFVNIGLPLFEGYGLTEASPVIACNYPGANRVGTVGTPFPGVEVRIAPDGEILARGPNIMRAYHHDGTTTRVVIDGEGWLRTGDLGYLDSDGFLTVTGRKKELFKTSTGEYISPVPIEHALCGCRLVDMALVIAEERRFLSCLLFPDFEEVARRMEEAGADGQSVEDFLKGGVFRMEIEEHIRRVNAHLNHWEQIRRFRVVPTRISIDGGELTPSLKLRRHLVEERFKDLINEMYES